LQLAASTGKQVEISESKNVETLIQINLTMENRIIQLFKRKDKKILSVYFTAGYPNLEDTVKIIAELEKNGADLIEIGIPFSDPVADGPVIQKSSEIALNNGMSINCLFEQLKDIRKEVSIPLILMGYLNPVMQYGIENFCLKCKENGIDGTIIPDLPLDIFEAEYKEIFEANQLSNIFLVTPQTPDERIRKIDAISTGFIYLVSSSSTTGAKVGVANEQMAYFERVQQMKLNSKILVGFGISDKVSFERASSFTNGAIIGSAFIQCLEGKGTVENQVREFIRQIS
jgi:tryptophan synthase alpha chain